MGTAGILVWSMRCPLHAGVAFPSFPQGQDGKGQSGPYPAGERRHRTGDKKAPFKLAVDTRQMEGIF